MRNTKKHTLLAILTLGLGLSTISASAEVVCQPAEQQFHLQGVGWDIETGNARIKNFDSKVHSGRVVYSRPHNEFGEKINILVPLEPDDIFRRDHLELVVFPINDNGQYRVLGAAFVTVDSERRMDFSIASTIYSCIEM